MSRQLLAFTILLIISNALHSQETDKAGFFLSAKLGNSTHNIDSKVTTDASGNGESYDLGVGYSFNQNYRIALGFTDYGDTTLFSVRDRTLGRIDFNSKASSVHLYGSLLSDEDNGWQFVAEAGISQNTFKTNMLFLSENIRLSNDTELGYWIGLGGAYRINSSMQLTFDFTSNYFDVSGGELAEMSGTDSIEVKLRKFSIGLSYQF